MFLVLLYISNLCVFVRADSESFQIRKTHLNKQLKGHTVMEIYVKHHHECAKECYTLSVCKSIDYYQGKCKLNDVDSTSITPSEFEDKNGAIFSDISDWPNKMVGSCGNQPCLEKNQKCFNRKGSHSCREKLATDCKGILRLNPAATSGQHVIRLWKTSKVVTVVCDMDTDGGGWTVFQNRIDVSVDFYRNSMDYENGFGNLFTEFWLGLGIMQEIVTNGPIELRMDLTDGDGTTVYETFQNFHLDAGPEYTIHLDPGQGTAGDDISDLGMSYLNGMHFTTKDVDRDPYLPENCAQAQHGAWWYNQCGGVNLNGEYATPGFQHPDGYWFGIFYQPYSFNSLKATKLMFR